MKPLNPLVLASFTLFSALACSDDDPSKETETFSTSLSDSALLGSLSSDQQVALCSDIDGFFSSRALLSPTEEFSCRLMGVLSALTASVSTDAEMRAACQTGYDECKKQPLTADEATCTPQSSSCTATVAELKACLNDYPRALTEAANSIPNCETLSLSDSGETQSTPELTLSTACSTLENKCPGALPEG